VLEDSTANSDKHLDIGFGGSLAVSTGNFDLRKNF